VASSLPVGAARRIRWTSVRTENSSNLAAGAKEMQKYSWKMVEGGQLARNEGWMLLTFIYFASGQRGV